MRKLTLIGLGAAVAVALGVAAPAQAGVVTYTSTDVPKSFDDGQAITSILTVPPGRTSATDIDVALTAGSGPNSVDRAISLRGPNGKVSVLVSGCNSFGLNTTFDDQAAAPLNPCFPGSGPVKAPNPLSPLLGPAAGQWEMRAGDPGNLQQALAGTMTGWSLRVTHPTVEMGVAAQKQRLKKGKVTLSVSCNANCAIAVGQDAKDRSLSLVAGESQTVKLPLRRKARKRLDDGGKAKLTLTATDETGGTVAQDLKIKIRG